METDTKPPPPLNDMQHEFRMVSSKPSPPLPKNFDARSITSSGASFVCVAIFFMTTVGLSNFVAIVKKDVPFAEGFFATSAHAAVLLFGLFGTYL